MVIYIVAIGLVGKNKQVVKIKGEKKWKYRSRIIVMISLSMGVGEARTAAIAVFVQKEMGAIIIFVANILNTTSAMLTIRTAWRRLSVNCINNITSTKSGPRVYYIRAVTEGKITPLCCTAGFV